MADTPDIGVISGTPNTGLEKSEKLIRAVDPILHFYRFDKHPFASMVLSQGQSLVARENSHIPKLQGKALRRKGYANMKFEWFKLSLQTI